MSQLLEGHKISFLFNEFKGSVISLQNSCIDHPTQGSLTADEAAARLRIVTEWLEAIDLVLLPPPVLSRASEPMPMPLGTLDAVHLATALIWCDRVGPLAAMATHDTALGSAARAFGFEVRGA
jgi:hypothetical protein